MNQEAAEIAHKLAGAAVLEIARDVAQRVESGS
jgi:hypothetical protein